MQKTLVVHHHAGIGDLIWHVPYFRAIAAASLGGKVTVMARPSCRATDILAGESCVEEVIEHDYRPRYNVKGKHDGIKGQLQFIRELRRRKFGRIYIFSERDHYAKLALLAGISHRSGYGFRVIQRLYLNDPTYIKRYDGPGSGVYAEATSFAMAHGFVNGPIVPKLTLPAQYVEEAEARLSQFPKIRYAFAIGASEPKKNWGAENFLILAKRLIDAGCGVVFLGGPAEREEAEKAFSTANGLKPGTFQVMCQSSVLKSAAVLKQCDFCIGNDTGVLNLSVACDTPALGLFGHTLPLTHDPLMHGISGERMHSISIDAVIARLRELNAPPIQTVHAGSFFGETVFRA